MTVPSARPEPDAAPPPTDRPSDTAPPQLGGLSTGESHPLRGAEPPASPNGRAHPVRPCVTELRLSAFAGHRQAGLTLGPVTLFAGPSGAGKTTALRAYEALARLGGGGAVEEVFPDAGDCVPERARPDAQRRRGFRIGCTADGPQGPVRLDVAVQAEPELRIVGERLTAGGLVLLETALRDPSRPFVQAAWHTAGSSPVTRAPLPDDRLGTALLPLRVAGKTDGQRRVLAAAEQMVVALRSVFACAPIPGRMRNPVPTGSGRLLGGCDNLADVLWRTQAECGRRHAQLVAAVRAGCAGAVTDVLAEPLTDGMVRALLDRGDGHRTALRRLGDGELRYVALALVLLTGPGVLEVDAAGEVPAAMQALTVLADGFDHCLDPGQRRELLRLATRMAARGHIRFVAAVSDASWAEGTPGATVVHLEP
ncbi:AAA family ATPase [Streptomyces pseudovenezuelae]|uniref:Energy-coupling factor transporter ATP-binding protein EcfA2 n=1 Tax=Streptomyces pseudovenezuelae TaxID=67350 RepID=A0ABT6LR38_9ACTN|nr:ATP-binding protein [Streptomyces pseudovenezuelae]MDH6218777.1 energy-coupling factor transporter ATP-binding protein EcfA2 [Streptomyces pseudovenezuelae]